MSTLSLESQIYIILVYEKCERDSGTALKTLYFHRLDTNIIILSFKLENLTEVVFTSVHRSLKRKYVPFVVF